jgi:hypothetical protein
MATPTFTLLNHQLLTTADANTGWFDLTTADPDIKVEGTNAMSGIFRADGEQAYYDAGSAPVSAAGKTFRGWILTNNLPYMGSMAVDPYKLLAYDGSVTALKNLFGSDTYPGGWFNIVWAMADFTTLTLANGRRWGVEAGHATAARNVVNSWMDVMRYLDGYSMVGGTSGDKVRLVNIAAVDKVSAYGVLSAYEGVYYATGTIQFGTGATAHHFEMDSQVLVFIEKPVAAGLYKLVGVGAGTNVVIKSSVIRSTGLTDTTRFGIDFDDANLAALTFTDNLVARASTVAFKAGQTCTGNTYDNCGQVNPGVGTDGADMRNSIVKGYEGTAGTAALVWANSGNPSGRLDGMAFTKGTAATHAIELGINSPTSVTLVGIDFVGYNAANGQNDSTFYVARTTGTVTINLSGCTGNLSYRSAGATVSLVNSTTLELTGLKNPTEVRVYNAGTTTEIAGAENVTTGTFSTGIDAAAYPSVDIAIVSLGYQNLRLLSINMATDRSIPIQQQLDRQYLNP